MSQDEFSQVYASSSAGPHVTAEPAAAGQAAPTAASDPPKPKIVVSDFCVSFDGREALRRISLQVNARERLGIIGPAGSGKTTFLRSLNRLNDLDPTITHTGRIFLTPDERGGPSRYDGLHPGTKQSLEKTLDGEEIHSANVDVPSLRRRVGMVYAVPNPLPWSIFENLSYGPKLAGVRGRARLEEIVERCLKSAFLWDEVKDRLRMLATNLSGGQQQRLCLARVLALEPEVLLLDEPCSGLDPISTARIEEALADLKSRYSIVLVTNNTKQAARATDRTAFFLMGDMIECGPTKEMFTNPKHGRTSDYITGHFG